MACPFRSAPAWSTESPATTNRVECCDQAAQGIFKNRFWERRRLRRTGGGATTDLAAGWYGVFGNRQWHRRRGVTATPYLVLKLGACSEFDSSRWNVRTVTADLDFRLNTNADTSAGGTLPDGLTASFVASLGTFATPVGDDLRRQGVEHLHGRCDTWNGQRRGQLWTPRAIGTSIVIVPYPGPRPRCRARRPAQFSCSTQCHADRDRDVGQPRLPARRSEPLHSRKVQRRSPDAAASR